MDAERWRRVQEVLEEASGCVGPDRDALLASRCAGDPKLRAEVESLLRAQDEGDGFFRRLSDRVARLDEAPGHGGAPEGSGVDPHVALHEAIGDRYRLEALIDEGGMGLVYQAVDRKHGRRVAIKTIQPELRKGMAAARFEREIRVTARLQHPHILPLLDSGAAGDFLFYIMPYVEGESLKARLDRAGRLPAGEAVRIAIDVADALAHAHGRGVLHRDVKPSNILLAENHVQVVDFGIARMLGELDAAGLTGTDHGLGTPGYMAPEQFGGESTPRSDVYALGAVLYESLTGRRWRTLPPDGSDRWQHVPEGLVDVLVRALKEAPEDRWAEVSDFARALRAWDRGAGAGAAVDTEPAGWWARLRERLAGGREPRADRKSIAVLPFDHLNRDAETEYFSDGITEDIIAHLSRIRELKVISRTSVMRFKGSEVSVREIGRELKVGTVLEGSVRRAGDRVRVVSQLIDVETEQNLWSQTFDRELTDIFDIQSEVAQRIAHQLEARITDAERSLIRRRPTEDIEAHELSLKGRHLWNRRTRVGLESAEEQFKRAVARDPLFAPAYAGLADTYLLLASYGYLGEIEALRKAGTAVDRALELDERLAEAHASRGQILRANRDWAGEEREYRRAIELNPNYATAHQWYATLLTALGRQEEARSEIELASGLDPLSHAIAVTRGIVRFLHRDYDGALADLHRTIELEPRFFSAYAWLVLLQSQLGEYDRALESWKTMLELHQDARLGEYSRSFVLASSGDHEGAREFLRLRSEFPRDAGWRGIIQAQMGEIDEAFHSLETALDDPSWRLFILHRSLLFYLKVGPWFDPIRDDPRFEGLLRRMNMTAT